MFWVVLGPFARQCYGVRAFARVLCVVCYGVLLGGWWCPQMVTMEFVAFIGMIST